MHFATKGTITSNKYSADEGDNLGQSRRTKQDGAMGFFSYLSSHSSASKPRNLFPRVEEWKYWFIYSF